MNMRISSQTVTFAHPFMLTGINGAQPSGAYNVETVEEVLQTASLPAFRRVSTSIQLPARPGLRPELTRIVAVDPIELAIVRARDALPQNARFGKRVARPSTTSGVNVWNRWVALNANELALTGLVVGAVLLAGLISR